MSDGDQTSAADGHGSFREAFLNADAYGPRWPQRLTALLDDEGTPAETRAAAIEALTRAHPRHLLARFMDLIADSDPGVRRATVQASSILVPEDRVKVAGPVLTDDDREVRLEAGRVLVGAEEELSPEHAPLFVRAREAWVESRRTRTESPEAWSELAALYAALGRGDDADRSLRRALELDPGRSSDWTNLADLYEATGRSAKARQTLADALAVRPDDPALLHARGLAHIRGGRPEEALDDLKRATKCGSDSPRYAYVYVVALLDLRGESEAMTELGAARGRHPRDPDLLGLAVSLAERRGDREAALSAARVLEESDPGNPEYQALVMQLRLTS